MPSPLLKFNVVTCSITTTRGAGLSAWEFDLKAVDDSLSFGTIDDNFNSFVVGATSEALKALKLVITGDAEIVAIQDMDTLVVDGFTIYLPALSGDDTLYVDSVGNTWFDEALTSAAGGVDALSETITIAETFLEQDTDNLSDTITIEDSITEDVEDFIVFVSDFITVSDALTDFSGGNFTEDTQNDFTWVEI